MSAAFLENAVFRSYCFYASILVVKTLIMSILTAVRRFKYNVFLNPEDCTIKGSKVRLEENIERVRRAHMNDLENIPVFLVIGVIYTLTDPSPWLAPMLFRIFTMARIAHTIVYAVVVVPQPARALSWAVGWFTTLYMAGQSAIYFL